MDVTQPVGRGSPYFYKGMRVEICPFQHDRICNDEEVLRMDGRRGTVAKVKNHIQGQIVYVHVDGERSAISYPTQALKLMVEGQP